MALNSSSAAIVSSKAPSNFEDEVTFTCTVSDPISGDPNLNTAPLGTVNFLADGTFGFGSATLVPITSMVVSIQSTTTIATYIGPNSFSPGQRVTIVGFVGAGFTQFNQTNVTIATANSAQFTVTGSYTTTTQVLVPTPVNAVSTSASQCTGSTTVLIPGLHTIQAFYLGDTTPTTGHTSSNSNILTQQVINVATLNVVEIPGFALIAGYVTTGDTSLPPQAQLYAIPATATHHQSINLLWNTLNVAFIEITGNNGVDYQPSGFDTGFVSTNGSGIYVVGNGFTADITLTLTAYDGTHTPLGLTSQVQIAIT